MLRLVPAVCRAGEGDIGCGVCAFLWYTIANRPAVARGEYGGER